ncbi:COesterase domain containing protein, partial [Asbolus verrucosus]
KWTHDNIGLFGGDPNRITVFGQNAGSSSVTYQLLNRRIEGLIQGGICESGTNLTAILNDTFLTNNDSQDLLEFLQSVPAKDVDVASDKYHDHQETPQDLELSQGFYWAPVVEVKNENAFMTKKMYSLLKAGNFIKVPILIGINSEEMLFINRNADNLKATMQIYDEHPDWLLPNDMLITDDANRTEMGLAIKKIYTKGEPLAEHLGAGIRFYSDNSFTRSVIKYAEIDSQYAPVYFYKFSYDGQIGGFDVKYEDAEYVAHNEELNYIFGNSNYSTFPAAD